MKILKYSYLLVIGIITFYACSTIPIKNNTTIEEPVIIKNDSLAYKIIIIDAGFTTYLNTIAKPIGFYSLNYLENKNNIYVTIWNSRANNSLKYNSNIYENIIDYNSFISYGYDVNYKLFNYFEFAQRKYRMTLR
ncbi:DUF6146 family protein [Tenacibaculum aestuariivivum]|uniref:DUF6146 family protein n=1 Tax=Tenacibaculum aestuariivivum TaxID=2006131 RepID=UPI003AB1182F